MFEIWDGDLFLFSVESFDEADTYAESGFRVVKLDMS